MMVNGASKEAQANGETIHYIYVSPEDSGTIERCVELAPGLSGMIVCGMVNSENLQCGLLDESKVVIQRWF